MVGYLAVTMLAMMGTDLGDHYACGAAQQRMADAAGEQVPGAAVIICPMASAGYPWRARRPALGLKSPKFCS
jgi:hypothetical protein